MRPNDDASVSGSTANMGTAMTETLEVPSTESNIAAFRAAHTVRPNCKDNISNDPLSQCESPQGIRVQV